MAGRLRGTLKTGGRKAGTPNKRTVALRLATAAAAEQINATFAPEVFDGDAHALLMTVYKDLNQPIGLRMEAAKAALPYEKPRLASIETKQVDDLEKLSNEELMAIIREGGAMVAEHDKAMAEREAAKEPPKRGGKPKLVA